MADAVVYDLLDGPQARTLINQMRHLYAEVYAEPPYCEGPELVDRFVEHFTDEVDTAGFSLARSVIGPELIGAVYGWTMEPGRWFRSAVEQPPEPIRKAPKFAIMEWMVRAPYRGSGIGRRLLELLLGDRPEPWAVLASNPAAPARRIYEQLGWRQYGTTKADVMPAMDILALPLSTDH